MWPSLSVVFLIESCALVRKGVIWLFLAIISGILPTVSLARFLCSSYSLVLFKM